MLPPSMSTAKFHYARMATLASTEPPPNASGRCRFFCARRACTHRNTFFLPLTRVLKRPIVCSESVKSQSNFGSPDNLSNFGAPATLVRHDDARSGGHWDRPFLHEVFHVYHIMLTRTRWSRPVWSVSPKARKTSGDLCVQRMVGLPQTTQAQQGHVFGGRNTTRDLLGSSCVAQCGATPTWLIIASLTVE